MASDDSRTVTRQAAQHASTGVPFGQHSMPDGYQDANSTQDETEIWSDVPDVLDAGCGVPEEHELDTFEHQVTTRMDAFEAQLHAVQDTMSAKLAELQTQMDAHLQRKADDPLVPEAESILANAGVPDLQRVSTKTKTEEEEQTTVPLGETMWEASLLLGMQEPGTVHTNLGLVTLLLNIFVQFAFAFIVLNLGADDRVTGDTAQAFQFWRLNIAHQFEFMDRITDQSLAARVCSGFDGIESSQGKACMHGHGYSQGVMHA